MTDTPSEQGPADVTFRSLIGAAYSKVRAMFSGSGDASVLARGASWSFLISTGGAAVGFGSQLVLTRVLGQEGYGIYAYALGWINTILLFTTLDFGRAAIRFVGAYVGAGEWGKVRAFLLQITSVVLGITIVIAVGAGALLIRNAERFTAEEFDAYLVACWLLPVSGALAFLSSVLVGLKRVALAQGPDLLLRPILFVTGLIVWGIVAGGALSPANAVLANLMASVVAVIVSWRGLVGALPEAWRLAKPDSELSFWLKTVAGLFAVSVSQGVLAGSIDIVVVGSFMGPTSAGLYALAFLMASTAWLGSNAVHFIGTPMIAEYHANRSRADLQRLITPLAQVSVAVSIPPILALAVFGRWALSVFFGSEFALAYPILLVMLLTTLQGVTAGILSGNVMTMSGHQNAAAWVVAVAAGVYLALVAPLASAYGAVGIAMATFLAFMVRTVLLTWYIRSRLKINILPIPWPVRE